MVHATPTYTIYSIIISMNMYQLHSPYVINVERELSSIKCDGVVRDSDSDTE